jgi:hypothetical protein
VVVCLNDALQKGFPAGRKRRAARITLSLLRSKPQLRDASVLATV